MRAATLFAIFLGSSLLLEPVSRADDAPFAPVASKFKLQADVLDEASGLAISGRSDDLMWSLNDSGGQPALYLAGIDGTDRGQCVIQGATNVDWEELSPFKLDGKPYLLIGDVGDNASKRQSCMLYIIAEPPLPKAGEKLNTAVPIAWSIPFVYPDSPRDCEAVAVDVATKKIILISKRTTPPVVYELPLKPAAGGMQTAKAIGTAVTPQPKGHIPIPYGAQPTGLAFSPDSRTAAVITYSSLHIFPRAKGESWAAALGRPAAQVIPHSISQTESVAFSSNGKTLRVVSEGVHTPILLYQR